MGMMVLFLFIQLFQAKSFNGAHVFAISTLYFLFSSILVLTKAWSASITFLAILLNKKRHKIIICTSCKATSLKWATLDVLFESTSILSSSLSFFKLINCWTNDPKFEKIHRHHSFVNCRISALINFRIGDAVAKQTLELVPNVHHRTLWNQRDEPVSRQAKTN